MRRQELFFLYRLADLYGIQVSYLEATGRRRAASAEALLAALRVLGAPLKDPGGAKDALREAVLNRWRKICEPAAVVWEGRGGFILLRLPATPKDARGECRLALEGGGVVSWPVSPAALPAREAVRLEGRIFVARELPLPDLPPGYHRLTVELPGHGTGSTLLICAPRRAYGHPKETKGAFGLFIPLYALQTEKSWGAGDFGDLALFLNWAGEAGAGFVGTLPLLALYLDEPFEPSPYAPVSRLFWNDFYLDVTGAPELAECPEARRLAESPAWREELEKARASRLVDYRRVMALKRQLIGLLAEHFFARWDGGGREFRSWLAENPEVQTYALFRAAAERRRFAWPSWPERMRRGRLGAEDADPAAVRYHLYAQWLASRQMCELSREAEKKGLRLYLDLPVGVHPHGYDTWRWPELFVFGACCGAPPDPFFAGGQDWGFPPLHPERLREQGYRYFISCLRHHLRCAGILRLDHAAGLHRLLWIPKGFPAQEGVYVRYPAEELYAILALESHRHRAIIVGEDLGTVPRSVRAAMGRHNLYRMYVLPFEMTGRDPAPLRPVPAGSLACLNTHDMAPFAAFWEGLGPRRRRELMLFLAQRGFVGSARGTIKEALSGCLAFLAVSRSRLVMLNLEDLWLEKEPQNVPGTGSAERPNWRRKARYTFEEFAAKSGLLSCLQKVKNWREEGPKWSSP